ncbi:beta-lactamase [Staphylococcus aureus]|nr:beta-lactamase [Staphylococcus aureus]CAC7106056.1 beta-lactamase [Staphylococcus aureus]CAC7117464.1 beta-lactamase [Staphylococcus aureus]
MNTKFLGKTLVASALVLTTLGTGLHSSYLGLDTNKVVKTAKAEEKMTDGQLWNKVKLSLIDSDIISGNKDEDIKVTYSLKDDNSSSVSAPGNDNGDNFNQKIDFKGLKQIDLTKENVYDDFNKELDTKKTWDSLTTKLKDKGLVADGKKVTIHCNDKSNNTNTTVSGKVGEGISSNSGTTFKKRFIDKITID